MWNKISKFLTFLLFIFLIILSLFGCSKQPVPTKIVYKTKIERVRIPEELLKLNEIPKPIKKEKYLELDSIGKENELTKYIIKLFNYIKIERKQIMTIKKINDKSKGE